MLGQNVKSHCWKTYMQPVKAQNEDFSQSRLQAGEYHASPAGMMHVGIRNWRYFPVSLQIVTLKIHIFNVSMSILVFHSPDIIMDKKINSLGLSQHLGNDLTRKKNSSSCLLSLLHSLSQKIFWCTESYVENYSVHFHYSSSCNRIWTWEEENWSGLEFFLPVTYSNKQTDLNKQNPIKSQPKS